MEMNIDYKALGQKIRKVRNSRKLTQETLAEICSLSAAHIGHIERGTRIPSLDTLFRISQALDVSLDYLIFDSLDNDADSSEKIAKILSNATNEKKDALKLTLKALLEFDANN